jgi:pimeloyl-ACP methyl ester carboxylesterase
MEERPTLLLVHGAWHGPWCWEKTIAALADHGLEARTVALPSCGSDPARLGGLVEDAAAVAEAAAAIAGDAVVVGHSYGGMAITEAAYGPNVKRLVYVGAFMPAEGRSLVSHFPPDALPPFVEIRADGSVALIGRFAREWLYGDVDEVTAADAASRLVLHSAAAIITPTSRCAWRTVPASYVICSEDRIIPPETQRTMAEQAADTRTIASSHSPTLSRPDELAAILAEIAALDCGDRRVASVSPAPA